MRRDVKPVNDVISEALQSEIKNTENIQDLVPEHWFELAPFELDKRVKQARLLNQLLMLHQHHRQQCPEYSNLFGELSADDIESYPYLAVRLFKYLSLASISQERVYKTLYSSGTTGQVPAKVILDQDTSRRQSKVLVKVLQDFIGKQRLPMLIIDHPKVISARDSYSARGAGIQGISLFGRKQTFALNPDMTLNHQAIEAFVSKYGDGPVLLFGFTFMVWQHFLKELQRSELRVNLPKGVLLHSGGWKKLEAQKVSNEVFKEACKQWLGVVKVHNFYGMAEQVGSIFVECEAGHLHAPVYADVLIRDPQNFKVLEHLKQGIIQVISIIPTSYPGHSLLTEDMGRILGEDDCPCGRKGKYFEVVGRLPKAEVRGCSDTQK